MRQSAHGLPARGESIDWRDPFPNVEPYVQILQEKGLELLNQKFIPFSQFNGSIERNIYRKISSLIKRFDNTKGCVISGIEI